MKVELDAPVAKVFSLLTDAKFLKERCLALGEMSADCKIAKAKSGTTVTMNRRVRRDLPALIARFFKPEQDFEIVEHWRDDGDGKKADYTLTIVGQPVTVTASIGLQPSGKGSVYTIQHACKAKVLLIGGAVEKYVLSQTEDGCAKELDYLAEAVGRKRK